MTGVVHQADAVAQAAQSDALTAYNVLAGRSVDHDLTGQDLGGLTLTPGVYALTSASSSSVSFVNGGDGAGVFWQVGSSATLGSGTVFAGSVLADQSITMDTGAVILCGRAIALQGDVTMDSNTLSHRRVDDVGGSVTLPEPVSFSLLALAGLGLALNRRRAA